MSTSNHRAKLTFSVTTDAYCALVEFDKSRIGTPDYMGIAYFWAYAYRHWLRGASHFKRQRVHDAFVAAGLPTDGQSAEHQAIVEKVCR